MQPDSNDIPFNTYQIDIFGATIDAFSGSGGAMASFVARMYDLFIVAWSVAAVIAFVLSALLLFGIIYTYIRANQLDEAVDEFVAQAEAAYRQYHGADVKNMRWNDVQTHIQSDRPNDWKLAIIEADVLLQETLDNAGYQGATIAEQLKSASPQSFQTVEAAWDAHKVRNQVAHSGTDFVLTKRVAQETITKYKMVFDEFGVI